VTAFAANFGRDLPEEMNREFEHRAFLVDHAIELAVLGAARQFADIFADTGDFERFGVDARVVQVDVPNEDRVIARNLVELVACEITALEQVVEVRADDPLSFRRARHFLLENINENNVVLGFRSS
jgi:hypothetical protein